MFFVLFIFLQIFQRFRRASPTQYFQPWPRLLFQAHLRVHTGADSEPQGLFAFTFGDTDETVSAAGACLFPGDGGRPGAEPSSAPQLCFLWGALPFRSLPQTASGSGKRVGRGLPSSETTGATHVQTVTAPRVPAAPHPVLATPWSSREEQGLSTKAHWSEASCSDSGIRLLKEAA